MKRLASLGLVMVMVASVVAEAPGDYAEFEVTASRLPGSRLPLNRVGAAVTVITEDEIARSSAPSLPAILQQKAGFTVYEQNGNSVEGVASLRGFKGGGDITVVVDGLRVNDPNGNGMDWNLVPLERIARIEIVRGGATNLNGPNTLSGVIFIWTKSGASHQGGSVRLGAGSFGAQEARLSYGRADERWDVTFGATGQDLDGYRDNGDARYLDLSTRVGLNLGENRLTVGYQHHQDRIGRSGELTAAEMTRDRRSTIKPHDYGDFALNAVTLGLERPVAGGRFDARVGWRGRDRVTASTSRFTGTTTFSDNELSSLSAAVEWTRAIARHQLSLLFDLRDDEFDERVRNQSTGAVTANRTGDERNLSGAARVDLALGRDWTLTGTVRYDHLEIENRDNRGDTAANGTFDHNRVSPAGSLVYHPSILGPNGRAFVSYSRAFRPPQNSQLFSIFSTTLPNTALRPEDVHTVEGGLFFGDTRVTFGLTAFQISMKDEIAYRVVSFAPFQGINVNLNRTERKGLEAYLGFRFLDHWSLTSELTWLNAKVVENVLSPANNGKRLPLVPRFQGSTTLAFERNRFRAEATHRYVGRRPVDFDEDNDKTFLEGHHVLDVGVGVRLRDWLRLDAGVTNVLDEEYASRAIDAGTVYFNPSPGIGFHGSLTATF